MKIKIIEPYDFNPRYDQRSLTPNPGPVIIATLLQQAGHNVEVLSEYVAKFDIEEANAADLVGISITTYNARRGFEIAQRIKKPIVFGGYHASLMPAECLSYGNYAIRGDGHPVVELADHLQMAKNESLDRIPNLVYRQNGKLHYNQTETKPINIVPDYGLVRNYYQLSLRRLLRIPLLVNGSRGCLFDCGFCAIKAVHADFQHKDIQVMLDDIQNQIQHQHFLSRFLPKIIWITDDNLFSDLRWAKDFLRALAELKTKYKFTIQARVDIAKDDELLVLMSRANINRVYVGIESLSQKSLADFKKSSSIADIRHAVTNIRRHGIDVHGLFVFGGDEFRKGDGLKVADFARQYALSGVLIQPLTAFPGTPLFKKLESEGRILHKEWRHYNGKIVFKPAHMTASELYREIYDCYDRVFSPWRVILFFFRGNSGWKLEFLGEAIFRRLEKKKMKNYVRRRLAVPAYISDLRN